MVYEINFFDIGVEREVAWGYIGSISCIIIVIICAIIITLHGIKMYSDLFTAQRKSVDHRRKKPDKSKSSYTIMLYLCVFSCIFWALATAGLIPSFWTSSHRGCYEIITAAATVGITAKMFMYLLFLARLYAIYGTSTYAYSKQKILISGGAIIIFQIGVILSCWFIWSSEVYGYNDINSYPNFCNATLEPVTMGLLIVGDSTISGAFLLAFMIPLRKTMKAVETGMMINQQSSQLKAQQKIAYTGTKTVILTIVAIMSTFFWATVTTLFQINFAIIFDAPCNIICLILMTPYYDDKKYYRRMCYWCIYLFAKKHYQYMRSQESAPDQQNVSKNNDVESMRLETQTKTSLQLDTRTSTHDTAVSATVTNLSADTQTVSVDTMDQLKVTADKLTTMNNANQYNEMD